MSSPLWNTIKSFWTPEPTNDPEWLRTVRLDKAAFIVTAFGVITSISLLVVTISHIVGMLT